MALIPCSDYYTEIVNTIPIRIKRTNPDALEDRWTPFVYSMDLSANPADDEVGNQLGAWSMMDCPATHSAQYTDERGNDFIVIAIVDRVYYFDWKRTRDEWAPNVFAPIYRMLRIGPIPYNLEVTSRGGYAIDVWKRFRAFEFALKDEPQSGDDSRWRVSVSGWDRGDWTLTMRHGAQQMRVPLVKNARAFSVRLEHSADEPVRIEHWQAKWDMLGKRIPNSKRVM